jgi:hypothetical protein
MDFPSNLSLGPANADEAKPGTAPVDEEGVSARYKADALRLAGSVDTGGPSGGAHPTGDVLRLVGAAAGKPSAPCSAAIRGAAPAGAGAEPATEPAAELQAIRESVAFLGLGALGTLMTANLLAAGLDALLDDRDERAGVKFKDADLLGIPWRVVVGRGAKDGQVELVQRQGSLKRELAAGDLLAELPGLIGAARSGLLA